VVSNLADVLASGGATLDDILKVTIYTVDIDGFLSAEPQWRPLFRARPASTLVEVRRLQLPQMLVEIEVVAAA
jgi:enamine deaminase RidA (YjgF/YER057c/UK114 family)